MRRTHVSRAGTGFTSKGLLRAKRSESANKTQTVRATSVGRASSEQTEREVARLSRNLRGPSRAVEGALDCFDVGERIAPDPKERGRENKGKFRDE